MSITPVEFDKLTRLIQRQMNLGEPVPPVYIRVISTVDTALSKEKDGKKKMDATKARALNTMKQKVKKAAKEFEADIKSYADDADAFNAKYAAATQPEPVPSQRRQRPAPVEPGADEVEEGAAADAFTTIGRGGKQYNLGTESLFKTLGAINEARGKKVHLFSRSPRALKLMHCPVEHRPVRGS